MAVSQKQIAEKLGVSIALVSRVLSGKASEIGIAPDTIARVIKTAEKMGYVPSSAALTLKGKSTRTIGVAVHDFNDPFFGALIKQIQIQAHEHNHSLLLAGFLNRIPDEQDLQALHKHAMDGLIVLGSDADARWLSNFSHLPIARIGHGAAAERSVRVTIDEASAAGKLIGHLISRKCTSAVYLSCSLHSHKIRQLALESASSESLRLNSLQSSGIDGFNAGMELTKQLISRTEMPDALICATDLIAIGALHALHDAGIAVPGKIAVTGFDGIAAAEQFIPSITTIRQPITDMVRIAVENVVEKKHSAQITLQAELIVGESA
jgi:LacI family transcriptional regulator